MAGFDNDVVYGTNVNFSTAGATGGSASILSNGQLLIGTTALNAGGTHINVGTITSPGGSVTVGYSSPNITLEAISTPPSPNQLLSLVDDFISCNNGTGQLNWTSVGASANIDGTPTHPGLVQIVDNAFSGIILENGTASKSIAVGGGILSLNFVISLVTLSEVANRYTTYVGLGDKDDGSAPDNGIYFSYSDNVNSGNWVINCINSTVVTSVNTAIAAITGYVNLGFQVNAAGTSVSFTINGSLVGSAILTNIPSASLLPFFLWIRSSGALPASLIDLFYLTYSLTTAR